MVFNKKQKDTETRRAARGIVRTDMQEQLGTEAVAFTLDRVLSEDECKEWIAMTEERGYEAALVNIGGGRQKLMPDVRNNMRCIWDSEELADVVFQRIKDYLPATFGAGGGQLVSLNERLRFLRYDPGERFRPHMDGCYMRPNGKEKSFITVQLYLNGGFKGGATNFLIGRNAVVPCVPQPGRVLIFQHNLLHEGEELKKGRKYAMRTDVMYRTSSCE